MSLARAIGGVATTTEFHLKASAFVTAARLRLVARSTIEAQAMAERFSPRVLETISWRSVVPVGTMVDSTWAGPLAPAQSTAEAFLASLRDVSAFDRLLDDTLRLPMNTRVAVVTAGG